MEGPVAVAPLAPGLSAGIAPEAVDLLPGESAELTVELSLDAAAPPRAHSDAAIALLAEGIAPWSFTVSVIRPMYWQMERWPAEAYESTEDAAPIPSERRVAVEGNRVPLPEPGMWVGRTRVLNPSAYERPVRICSPSNYPARVWLNGEKVVENPGGPIRPSYHANPAHHYGEGILLPGWNDLTAAWLRGDEPGEAHLFLTAPDGTGWGDLVFEP